MAHYSDYTQNDYRTELDCYQIMFGNPCSVIAEPVCFGNQLVSVISVSAGLPNPWIYLTELFWELYSGMSVEKLPNRLLFELIW